MTTPFPPDLEDDDADFVVRTQAPPPPPVAMPTAKALQLLQAIAAAQMLDRPHKSDAWNNPTSDVVRVTFGTGHAQHPSIILEWKPGETHTLDRVWGRGIHQMTDFGGRRVVSGGLAPQLRRVGASTAVHPALYSDGESVFGPNPNPNRMVSGRPV